MPTLGFTSAPNIQTPLDSENHFYYYKVGSGAPISSLLAASIANTINNGSFTQEWQWNTLATQTGLKLSSTSTVGDASKMLEIVRSGTNSTSNKTNYGLYYSITNAGTGAVNYGLYGSMQGANNSSTAYLYSTNGALASTNTTYSLITAGAGNTLISQNYQYGYQGGTALLTISPAIALSNANTNDINTVLVNGTSKYTGTKASNRDFYIRKSALWGGGGSNATVTNASTLAIEGATTLLSASVNDHITNTHAILVEAGSVGGGGTPDNSYGITVNTQTGANNNYCAQFLGGNVGIGLSAPTSSLHVKGAGSTSATSALAVDNSSSTSLLFVRNDGNVGIGTSSPIVPLHIYSTTTNVIERLETTFATGYSTFYCINPNGGFYIGKERSTAGALLKGDLANAGVMSTDNASPLQFGTNDTVRMTILGTGNIGIGNANPATKLQVSSGQFYVDYTGKDNILLNSTGTNYGTIQNDAADKWSLGTGTNTATLSTPILTWTKAGLIGIGTTSPTSTLHISGSTAHSYVTKTANYTATFSDYGIFCNTNSFTITLPTAVGCEGREYFIKQIGSGTTITLATTSSQTIDGAVPSIYNLTTQYSYIKVMSDGANWVILDSSITYVIDDGDYLLANSFRALYNY